MNQSLQAFTRKMDSKGIKYSQQRDDAVSVSYSGDNAPTIRILFVFGDDNADVAVRVFSIVKVPEDKKFSMCRICSDLNNKFRWIKFYLDKDDEVTAAMDAVITPDTAGNECEELLHRTVRIVDEAYPVVMKGIYA